MCRFYSTAGFIVVSLDSDWSTKSPLLNDPRFTPELIAKEQPIPIGIPSLPSVWKAPIDKTTTTLKDGSGNVTGTEESTTEAEISNPTSQENPTNNPNLVKVTETTVKNTYNINNQLTSSTTTTTGNQNHIGVDMLSLMGLGGIGEAMGIIVGATTFKITMTTVKRLGLKQS